MVPTDIEFLSFSHFDWDHTGNANAFTHSTWLLSRREVEALESSPPPPNVKPGTLSGRTRPGWNLSSSIAMSPATAR